MTAGPTLGRTSLRTETKVAGGLAVAGAAATLGTGIYAIMQHGKDYTADSIAAAGVAATGLGYMSAYRMAKTDAGAPPKTPVPLPLVAK